MNKRIPIVLSILLLTSSANADMFGGDTVIMAQLLSTTVQQLVQLKQILATGSDTLGLLRDVNQGIKDGLSVVQLINPKFNPGLYGDLDSANKVLAAITELYGKIPQTPEARLQQAQDQSVAESIAMNGSLFHFADEADIESRRIIEHSRDVNPQGAAKLTAQSLAILIGVTTQVLRTNSMMLKMMGENMALQNRKSKLQSEQFKTQYDGLSSGLSRIPTEVSLGRLGGGR